jgi:hypothetical protein
MKIVLLCFIIFITSLYDAVFYRPLESNSIPTDIMQIDTKISATNELVDGKDWNGDGIFYQEYKLSQLELESVTNDIKNSSRWTEGALSEELKELLSKSILYSKVNTNILTIDNGYYFFKDRHKEATGNLYYYNPEIVDKRSSYNYIIAALDVDDSILYYYQVDT